MAEMIARQRKNQMLNWIKSSYSEVLPKMMTTGTKTATVPAMAELTRMARSCQGCALIQVISMCLEGGG